MDERDQTGEKLGMWLFLFTEIMLFGGLFVLYAVYYTRYTPDFIAGGQVLSKGFGVLNTVILLTSSFAVAASITAIRKGSVQATRNLLIGAIVLGIAFLVNKYFEWGAKFELGIYPNSDALVSGAPGRNIFFGLYYTITGLHGIHILIGLILLLSSLIFLQRQTITPHRYVFLDHSGLYWHLVDLIWIFVFPLFYLIL